MPTSNLPVDARGLTKWYGARTALDGVHLTVGRGRIHGLLGPNGAGKTTLLSMLFGLVRPDEGTLRLFGQTQGEAGSAWLNGVGGFVESPCFYPYLSGRLNLRILSGLDGTTHARDELVDEVLDVAGLGSAAATRVREFSLGMRQRLGLAAALLRAPRLLILDEPTNGLDPAGVRDLHAAVRRLADQGMSVLLSSHDMAQVEALCDDITVLHRGHVVFAGALDTMREAARPPTWQLRTSDDRLARTLAPGRVTLEPGTGVSGLAVRADQRDMDDYVLWLARASVAVRSLTAGASALESLFFELTEQSPAPRAEVEVAVR